MKLPQILIIGWIVILGGRDVNASPARFWISASKNSPTVPEAPIIDATIGSQKTLYIWAQPATDGVGLRTLQNLSLDVVTQTSERGSELQPFIDFIDGTFKIYNDPISNGKKRFQYTSDSFRIEEQGGALLSEKSESQVLSGQSDAIRGLQGFSLVNDNVVGIGSSSDPNCVTTGNCSAWLVAEFSFRTLQPIGTNVNMLYLQVGYAGMTSGREGETEVLFGNNTAPIYNTANAGHRQISLASDSFDLQVNAVSFTNGDYNSDGIVNAVDYSFWRSTIGETVAPGSGADGSANGIVDAADYVLWRNSLAVGGGSAAQNGTVPEPGTTALVLLLLIGTPLGSKIQRMRTTKSA